MTPGQEDSPQRALKRRKVAESCKVCRAKKTRCDGRRPECSSCMAKGAVCEYNDATVPISAATLASIEARLRKLEDQVNSTKADAPGRRLDTSAHIGRPFVPTIHCQGRALAHRNTQDTLWSMDSHLTWNLV